MFIKSTRHSKSKVLFMNAAKSEIPVVYKNKKKNNNSNTKTNIPVVNPNQSNNQASNTITGRTKTTTTITPKNTNKKINFKIGQTNKSVKGLFQTSGNVQANTNSSGSLTSITATIGPKSDGKCTDGNGCKTNRARQEVAISRFTDQLKHFSSTINIDGYGAKKSSTTGVHVFQFISPNGGTPKFTLSVKHDAGSTTPYLAYVKNGETVFMKDSNGQRIRADKSINLNVDVVNKNDARVTVNGNTFMVNNIGGNNLKFGAYSGASKLDSTTSVNYTDINVY